MNTYGKQLDYPPTPLPPLQVLNPSAACCMVHLVRWLWCMMWGFPLNCLSLGKTQLGMETSRSQCLHTPRCPRSRDDLGRELWQRFRELSIIIWVTEEHPRPHKYRHYLQTSLQRGLKLKYQKWHRMQEWGPLSPRPLQAVMPGNDSANQPLRNQFIQLGIGPVAHKTLEMMRHTTHGGNALFWMPCWLPQSV